MSLRTIVYCITAVGCNSKSTSFTQHIFAGRLPRFATVCWLISGDNRGRRERLVGLTPGGTNLVWGTPVVVLVVEGRL